MLLHKIAQALERIEANQARILERMEPRKDPAQTAESPDEWLQKGIDNILGYQAGQKREVKR